MSTVSLVGVVALQVVVFQFLSARFTVTLSEIMVGVRDLPEPVASKLHKFHRRTAVTTRVLGSVLLLAALVLGFLYPAEPHLRKLGLAAVSLASSAAFSVGVLRNRRRMTGIAALLPESGVRSAMLERRSLGRHYPPLWEVVPVVLFVATVALTIWAVPRVSVESAARWDATGRLWFVPLFQGTYLLFVYILGFRLATRRVIVPQRSRSFVGTPEQVTALNEALRTLKLRTLLAVKVAVALMFGIMQIKRVQLMTFGSAAPWLSSLTWILIAAMLVAFASLAVQMSRIRKRLLA